MAGNRFIQIPANLEDPQVLKQFTEELVSKLHTNPFISYPLKYPAGYTGYIPNQDTIAMGALTNDILDASQRLDELNNDIKNYITDGLQTNVLQNTEDVATVTVQFGTFYDTATAASWYGLGVKAGEVITGLTIGSVDTDTTTPGSGTGIFAINADSFQVARSITDITDPAELAYLQANNLPYGTMYDSVLGEIVPAFLIEWNGTSYDIFFNGKTTFSNVTGTGSIVHENDNITRLLNDAEYTLNTTFSQNTEPTAKAIGDLWVETDNFNNLYRWTGTVWEDIRDTSNDQDLSNALADIAGLEETDDGVINSFYQTAAPTGTYGDWWVDTDSSPLVAYRYEDIDGKNVGTLAWRDNSTSILGKSYLGAVNAQSTADGKITTFYQSTPPTAEGTGDIWVDTGDGNRQYMWSGVAWADIQDSLIGQAISDAAGAQSTADGKIETFYQIAEPTTASEGDIWFDTDDGNKVYTYRSGVWVNTQDSEIAQAITDAAGAQATADGKVKTFYNTVAPTAEGIGDLWVDTSDGNALYRWDGASWVIVRDTTIATAQAAADAASVAALLRTLPSEVAAAVNNNTTTIDGNKLTTGTVSALQILAGTITAAQIATKTITAAEIAAGTITAAQIATNTIAATQIAANTITSDEMSTNVLLVGGKIESSTYSWNGGAPIGFGLYSAGDTVSGEAYNIIGGKIYGAQLDGIELNIQDINLKDAAGTTIASHFSGRGRVSLDSSTLPKVMSIFFDFYAGDDNRVSAFKTLQTGSYLSIGSEANSAAFGVVQRDGMEFLFTSDDSTITCGFYAGVDLIGSTSTISADPDSHLGVGFSRFADGIGGDTYSYYIHTKSVMTAYELNGNGYLEMRLTSGTTMGTFLTSGFKLDYSISNM